MIHFGMQLQYRCFEEIEKKKNANRKKNSNRNLRSYQRNNAVLNLI